MTEPNKPKRKVLFIRANGSLLDRVAVQAEKEDLSINDMATILLKKGLEIVEKVKGKQMTMKEYKLVAADDSDESSAMLASNNKAQPSCLTPTE